MKTTDNRIWPFNQRTTLYASLFLLIGLLAVFAIVKSAIGWPGEKSEALVLVGIFVISLLPVVLTLIDIIMERGGVIKAGGVEINFSSVSQTGTDGFTIPTNIGVPGTPINDSSTEEILDALRQATECETVVIDLKDGQAWWETRLLVLLSGAARLGRPEKIIFTGKVGGIDGCFHGWGYAAKLLPYLVKAHPQYQSSYHAARAAGRQWEMVEPVDPPAPANQIIVPPQPATIQGRLATAHPWMAFNPATGLPNALLPEQLLASDLGEQLESKEGPKPISTIRLRELFQPVLYAQKIDTSWTKERQLTAFFDSTFSYLAITQKNKFLSLISRVSVLNTYARSIALGH